MMNPIQRLDQPLANAPYTMPNAMIPAKLWERTPQSTNVAREVQSDVEAARTQEFHLSERWPVMIRPKMEEAAKQV